MKKIALLFSSLLFVCLAPAWAGSEMQSTTTTPNTTGEQTQAVPLDIFNSETAYTFESDLNHGGSFGKQDEIQNELEYAHRFQISGNLYLHAGVSYDRFDFGTTNAPVPDHLQSFAGVIGVDYMHGSDVGAFFQIRPGFYTQNDFGSSSFDCPITLGRIFVIQTDKLYLFAGAYAAFLRGGYPVLPLGGVIWIASDNLRLMGVLPEPKLIYSPTKNLDLYVGGEVSGGSFRTDRNSNIVPAKLDGTQVDFSDYRAGVGLTYAVCKSFTADFGAGYSIERQFAFHRAGENYRTDPSPYLRLELKAQF
jgi:hypothetical protein